MGEHGIEHASGAHSVSRQSSFYDRFLASYALDADGSLILRSGPQATSLKRCWSTLIRHIVFPPSNPDSSARTHSILPSTCGLGESHAVEYFEKQLLANDIVGIVVRKAECLPFDDVYTNLALDSIQSGQNADVLEDHTSHQHRIQVSQSIAELFDQTLRHVTKDDEWDFSGRDYFVERILHFVSQNLPIELCLPAFPCKSSNLDKVSGVLPDRGERIALETLHTFICSVQKIYDPGAVLWIISDGHVFSDCIGVDDAVVDRYNEALQTMNNSLALDFGTRDRVLFRSLVELLRLDDTNHLQSKTDLQFDYKSHFFATQIDRQAELSRQILLSNFRPDSSILRSQINACDPSTLSLYRGFSRFMLEDLENNRYALGMSRSQRKKLSSKIAIEMIERNQAYSNLIETLLPYHVRLSIHAHNNAGPKFGIDLLGAGVRAVRSLTSFGEPDTSQDLLHVPTPWHGCIVEVEGHAQLYMTKSHAAEAAIQSQKFRGSWDMSTANMGGLYRFQDIRSNDEPRSPLSTTQSALSSIYTENLQATIQIEEFAVEPGETYSSTTARKPVKPYI